MLNEEGLKAAVKAYAEREMGKGCPVWEEDFPPIRAAITAYLATVQGEPVAVKNLEWKDGRISNKWERLTAETIFGQYEALEWSDGGFGGSIPNGEGSEEFSSVSLEAAKAAAQADFETRIRSAIITHPADRDGVEARTIDEWHEDDGSVCWWALDENGQWLGEPAYIGSPLDLGRAYSLSIGEHEFVATLGGWPGYHTHWTPHPALPTPPASAPKGGE